MIGRTLSHFEITAKLGEGGMGEVYRGLDTKLGREVAIKVLPPDFVRDAERLARFEREAKVLASLDHPNIAGIYEVGHEGDVHFLAMQLAAGKDLATALERGPLAVETALAIALQIAEGLEAAHESDVVHRDLKPGNVMVDFEGGSGLRVKLLDFGLAKARESAAEHPNLTHSPTLTARMTSTGTILGTAAYMSPEQARGLVVDKRADIWAFGCVLFEMLTARRAFDGSDVTEVLAAIIRAEPDLDSLPGSTSPRIRELIARCLRKDARRRLRDIGDARTVIEDVRDSPLEERAVVREKPSGIARALPWLLGAALALLLLFQLRPGDATSESGAPLRRFTIDLPWQSVVNWSDFGVAISPTGTHIAHNGRVHNRVDAYIRPLDSLDSYPVAPAREAAWLFFSPAGDWLAFESGTKLSKVPVRGGQPVALAELREFDTYGCSWGPDDVILVGARGGLYAVPASGGPAELIVEVDQMAGEVSYFVPSHLPGGRRALISIIHREGPAGIGVVDLAQRTVTRLPLNGFAPLYTKTGHLLFQQRETILAVPFDASTLEIGGEPVPVLDDVELGPYVANDGTMIYVPTRGEANARLVWVDRSGRLDPIAAESRNYSHLDLSHDGRTALLNVGSDVYSIDLERGSRQKLAERSLFPIFSPDDQFATFRQSPRAPTEIGAIVRRPAGGGGSPESLVEGNDTELDIQGDLRPSRATVPTSWNPRTGDLAFFDNASDIWVRYADGTVSRFLDSEANERSGRFSPDGNWLAYVSDATGEYQVYVVPYPGPGPRIAVSVDGGLSPIWSPDGSELLFRYGGKVMSAAVRYTPELSFEAPVELFEGPYTVDFMGHQRWDVAPDGERFLMVENSQDYRIVIVQNWFEELERLVPRGR